MMQIGELVFYGGRVLLEMELVARYVVMICQPRRVIGCRIQSDGRKGALRLRRVGAELEQNALSGNLGLRVAASSVFPKDKQVRTSMTARYFLSGPTG